MEAIAHPLSPVIAMSGATTIVLCVSVRAGIGPSPATELVLRYGWALMLLLWMDADARRLRRLPCFDFGLLAIIFFPLSLVWYCYWSRRWRGFLVLLMLLALWLVPYAIAMMFWMAVQL